MKESNYDHHPHCLFSGKFKVVSLYLNIYGKGWTLFKRYRGKSFSWSFAPEKAIRFPSGTLAFEGWLREKIKGMPEKEREYTWYPAENQLYIDRSDIKHDEIVNICLNNRYRTEHIKGSYYWLYDLEGVEHEPQDYRLRMKIKLLG